MTRVPHVVVLGGGFGGLSAAAGIRDALGPSQAEVTVIDKRGWFMVGFAKLWIMRGTRTFEDSAVDIGRIAKRGIRFVKDEVSGMDLASKTVRAGSRDIRYDFLVIALGARLAPERIPGLAEHALILYDHSQLPEIRRRLESMRSGRLALAIAGMPYKCPPAPFEACLLINSMLEESGARPSVRFDVYSPAPATLPAAGSEVSGRVLRMMESKGISFHGRRRIEAVEPGRIAFEGGAEAGFDLLLAVPPHEAPEIVYRAGLAEPGGFVKTGRDCRTPHEGVYAVGDVVTLPAEGGLAVPKAGIFAEGQGEVVAQSIISQILSEGRAPLYDGRGGCFLESGEGTASLIEVDMFGQPAPVTRITEPAAAHLDAKKEFEAERLRRWF